MPCDPGRYRIDVGKPAAITACPRFPQNGSRYPWHPRVARIWFQLWSSSPLKAIVRMETAAALTPSQLFDFLLKVALVRPVYIWGPPGIGKSALVEGFAQALGVPCVSLLGSQLAPEDLIGVPQIADGKSRFCPPEMIARDEPYVLFLDELNASTTEVQKAFYSLIHERRLGAYRLHPDSIVVGAGNRAQDNAIVRPMPSALINRMVHVQLKASARDWLAWADGAEIHPVVLEYIRLRPDHLWSAPPKHEGTFSTPRTWHMLSDALTQFGTEPEPDTAHILAAGCLTPEHAVQFRAFLKQRRTRFDVARLFKGETRWPDQPQDRDILYFLAQSFRAHLVKDLPAEPAALREHHRDTAHRAKGLLKDLAAISLEVAQMVVAESDESRLPDWLLVEIVRDLPRLAQRAG